MSATGRPEQGKKSDIQPFAFSGSADYHTVPLQSEHPRSILPRWFRYFWETAYE
jgi:hypothetical protein